MATIGLCKPYYAMYTNTGGTISYGGKKSLGKAVELSMDLDEGDENILYADNGPAEKDSSFGGGTLTITTDDLLPSAAADILGVELTAITNTGITDTTTPKEMIFDDSQTTPYVGFGIVVKKKQSGVTKWLSIVWPKVQFSNPGLSAVTQGETIEWQTPELTATIMRDDSSDAVWVRQALLDSEADAIAYIDGLLAASNSGG